MTRRKKWIIAIGGAVAVLLIASCIYAYDQHLRSRMKETLIDHTWRVQGMDWSNDITFRRDYTIEVEDEAIGGPYRGTGTWRLYGRDLLELTYSLRSVRYADERPDPNIPPDTHRWHISKFTRDELIVEDVRPIVYKRVK